MGIFSNKYYFVSANDVEKALWLKQNSGYCFRGRVKGTDYFLTNGIPKDFQKIVLFVPFFKKLKNRMNDDATTKQNSYFAQELISEYQFCMVSNGKNNGESVHLINVPFDSELSKNGIYDLVSMNLTSKEASIEEVKKFFIGLKRSGLVTAYFDVLSQLFEPNKEALKNLESSRGDYSLGDIEKVIKR